jgi:Cu2+-containing amine oxidase
MRIRSAKFMWKDKGGKPQWITVARMLELGEIYVPYDNGYTAFMDVHHHPFYTTPARKEFLGPNCVAPGEILKSANPTWNETVHKEVHDDGVRWMSAETNDRYQIADRVRRGEKMILWATYFGANYRYILEYNFRDDGMITCRLGFTGRNLLPRQADLLDTHLHVGCWRMEMDLGDPMTSAGGPKDNDVLLVRRVFNEGTEKFEQVVKPFAKNSAGQACEGSARWKATEFTSLRVQSRVRKNVHGRPIAFDILPHRWGSTEQLQSTGYFGAPTMDWINNDFWVTRTESGFTDYVDVAQYAAGKRPLEGYPTTIWHSSPALHVVRTEDYGDDDGINNYNGLALTGWAEFHIKPRDLFDGTPLYKPTRRMPRFRFVE